MLIGLTFSDIHFDGISNVRLVDGAIFQANEPAARVGNRTGGNAEPPSLAGQVQDQVDGATQAGWRAGQRRAGQG